MNYEKKYKEALKLARDYYKANVNLGEKDENSMLEDIFPELAESEDERIRKALIQGFYEYDSSFSKFGGIDVSDILAWLEKQDEPKWTEEDEKNWRGIIDEIEANKSNAPDYDIETYDRFLSWLDNIKQRMGEQQ